MKFKYCVTLTVILLILCSLTTVVASDNITGYSSSEDVLAIDSSDSAVCVSEDLNDHKSQAILDDAFLSGDDDVDLSVKIDGENIYRDDKFNRAGYEVPWNITAMVDGGTAKNVKVHVVLSDLLEPLSINENMGTFDPETGIWDIGDLSSSNDAVLSILTKIKSDGRFKVTADATTTSNDIDLSNNDAFLTLKSGTGKKPSNTTSTSDSPGGSSENPGSDPNNPFIVVEEEGPTEKTEENPPEDPSPSTPNEPSKPDRRSGVNPNPGEDPGSDDNGGSSSNGKDDESEGNSGSLAKSTKSFSNTLSEAFDSLGSIFGLGSDEDNSNSEDNVSDDVAKAVSAQDYSKIPILIFAFVLIAVAAVIGYGKIKS